MSLLISMNSDANKRNVNKYTYTHTHIKNIFTADKAKWSIKWRSLWHQLPVVKDNIIINMLRETVSHKWHYDEAY